MEKKLPNEIKGKIELILMENAQRFRYHIQKTIDYNESYHFNQLSRLIVFCKEFHNTIISFRNHATQKLSQELKSINSINLQRVHIHPTIQNTVEFNFNIEIDFQFDEDKYKKLQEIKYQKLIKNKYRFISKR